MSVVIETTLGDVTVDLYMKRRPRACLNFLKLCKLKYYNYNLFHTVTRGFIAQTGDPTGSRTGGESIFGVLEGPLKRYFEPEVNPRIKHTTMGLISFVGNDDNMVGSQFFLTLGSDLTYLDEKHCVFGEVAEGVDVLEIINEAICDTDDRPYQDIRITHTVVLDDPFPDPGSLRAPSRSPSPSAERLQGGRIAPDEEIDETAGKSAKEINEMIAEREAKARATILEMVGDIPDAEMAPPENVLFVCKLNPVTSDDDLEIIFSRFGKIKSCEVIRDRKSGDSLQYAFVEFENEKSCEDAYFKMDNVLIDDRRIHVDFSQSVSKIRWLGKGRGVRNFGEKDQDLGKGQYHKNGEKRNKDKEGKKRERIDKERDREQKFVRRKENYDDRSKNYRDKDRRYERDRDRSYRDVGRRGRSDRDRDRNERDRDRFRSNSDRSYDYDRRRDRSRSPKYRSNDKEGRSRKEEHRHGSIIRKKQRDTSSSGSEEEVKKKAKSNRDKPKKSKRKQSSDSEHEKRKQKKSKKKKKKDSSESDSSDS